MQPDENRDVIIHYIREFNAATGTERECWMLFVGPTEAGEEPSEERAIRAALRLGQRHDRPVWLLDKTGHPLKPITDDDRTVSFTAHCPKDHRPTVTLKAGDVRHRLDDVKFFCISCGENFQPDDNARTNLRRYVELPDSWY